MSVMVNGMFVCSSNNGTSGGEFVIQNSKMYPSTFATICDEAKRKDTTVILLIKNIQSVLSGENISYNNHDGIAENICRLSCRCYKSQILVPDCLEAEVTVR